MSSADAVATLRALAGRLEASPLKATAKRQCGEYVKAVTTLEAYLGEGKVGDDVLGKLGNLAGLVAGNQWAPALAIQVSLASSDWTAHKAWLKGLKYGLQLASKHLA
jgi:hypothetical protein